MQGFNHPSVLNPAQCEVAVQLAASSETLHSTADGGVCGAMHGRTPHLDFEAHAIPSLVLSVLDSRV
jgi:hypothetical protein